MSNIQPVPDEAEAAAIVTALELLWPQPAPPPSAPSSGEWRFSGRAWQQGRAWPRRGY